MTHFTLAIRLFAQRLAGRAREKSVRPNCSRCTSRYKWLGKRIAVSAAKTYSGAAWIRPFILLLPITLAGLPNIGEARGGQHHYRIPQQTLVSALTLFAEQSNIQILFRSEDIPNRIIAAVDKTAHCEDMLQHLLKGTGLHYQTKGEHVVAVFRKPVAPTPVPTPPPAQAPALAQEPPLEEVNITGIRSSLLRNLQIKRNAIAQVDAVTAEQVNKFPDKNVADALQRIAGVSIDRIWGEGRDINIRGTDKDINRTLMNGQNVASAYWWANDNPSRGFNYTILPSELIASLEVYKSPQADIDEGSIGGTVIIHTQKPFDIAQKRLAISLEEHYNDLADAYDPQMSMMANWVNAEQSFGVLASVNWQNRSMRRDGLEAFPDNSLYDIEDENGQITEDVYVIWGGGSAIFRNERQRLTHNLTAQWQPSIASDVDTPLSITFNHVDSQLDLENNNQNYLFMPGGFKLRESPPVSVTEPRFGTTGDGRLTLLEGTLENSLSTGAALDAIFRETYIRSAVYDLDIEYDTGASQMHVQVGTTKANGGSDHDRLYRFEGNTRHHFALSRDSIEVQYLDLNPEDPAALPTLSADTHDWIRNMQDSEDYAQFDLERPLAFDWLSKMKLGVKWRDHTIENRRIVGEINTEHTMWPSLAEQGLHTVSSSLTPRLHQQTATEGSLTRFAWADESLVKDNIDTLLQTGVMQYDEDMDAFYRIREKIYGSYLMFTTEQERWTANWGIRAVHTEQNTSAYNEDGHRENQDRHYSDYLPSGNIVLDITDTAIWRTSLAKVMARPTFQNLSSNIVYDGTSSNISSGNPELSPYRAKQLDSGIEWYISQQNFLSATAFYKDISTFIYTRTGEEIIGGQSAHVTRPYNAEGATIYGLEFQYQHDFEHGIGWLSNYTYTHANVPSADGEQMLKLPGNSRDQINTSLYFEGEKFTARLSYNYRSKSYGQLISGTQDETRAYQQWDFTAAWSPSLNSTVYFEGINLSNEAIYYRTANNIPQGLYETGRRYHVGLRLNW